MVPQGSGLVRVIPNLDHQSDSGLLTFFNCNFKLPNQNSWTVCQPTSAIATRVISVLTLMPFTLDDWRQLPAAGKHFGITGKSMWRLWEWTLTFRIPTSQCRSDSSPALWHESAQATVITKTKSKIAQSVACLRPLARQSRWSVAPTPLKL